MSLRTKFRKLLKLLTALLVLTGMGLWFGRDLPRRRVETMLEEALGAPVALESLVLEGPGTFRLEGLSIGAGRALPQLAGAEIAQLRIEGSLPSLRAGEVENLTLEGAVLRLQVGDGPPPPGADLRFRRVRWSQVEVWFETPTSRAGPLILSGELRNVGSPRVAGEIEGRSEELSLVNTEPGPEGRVTDLEGRLRLLPGRLEGQIRFATAETQYESLRTSLREALLEVSTGKGGGSATFSAGELLVSSPTGPQSLDAPQVRMSYVTSRDPAAKATALEVETEISLSGASLGSFVSELDPGTLRPRRLEGSLEGLPLKMLLPWLETFGMEGGDGELRLAVEPAPDPGASGQVRVALGVRARELRIRTEDLETTFRDLRGEARAELDLGNLGFPEDVDLEVDLRISELTGGLLSTPLPPQVFPADLRWQGSLRGGGLEGKILLRAPLLGSLQSTLRRGAAGEGTWAQETWRWMWTWKGSRVEDLLPLLPRAGLSWPPDLRLEGPLQGQGTFTWKGPLPTEESLQGQGKLILANLQGRGSSPIPWILSGLRGEIHGSLGGGGFRSALKGVRGQLEIEPLAPIPWQLDGRLIAGSNSGVLEVPELALKFPGLVDLQVEGSSSLPGIDGRLRFSEAGLAPWRDFLRPLTGELGSGLTLAGRVRGELEFRAAKLEAWSLEGPVWVEESGFSSDDGARVLEGLESRWQVRLLPREAARSVLEPPVSLEATAQIGGFQLLLGTFFADFSDLTTSLSLDARLIPGEGGSSGLRAALGWRLDGGAALEATLVRRDDSLEGTLDLSLEDLERLLDQHLRTPLLDASPRFEKLTLGGDLSLHFEGTQEASGDRAVKGKISARDLSLAGLGPARLDHLHLDLPMHRLQTMGQPWRAGEPAVGMLGFRGLEVGGLALEATEVPLTVHGDSISLRRPLVLPVAGGRLVLEDLSLLKLLQPEKSFETALRLEGLELERLSEALGMLPLEGRLDGRLPKIRLGAQRLEVEGGGEIRLFGGTIEVGDISGEDLFSRYPKLVFSADFEELDLARITRRFDVGEMTGVLQGSLRSCELFRSVLVRCSGRFETVRRPGTGRTISVKAVNNIAILGTGQNASFLDRGITRFFNRFTYSRLGIEMSLAQDVFLLRGLETRGEKELFLRGRLPFPIDVVNAQPGRTVSFQTMIRRLESLDFGGAVTEPPTPEP